MSRAVPWLLVLAALAGSGPGHALEPATLSGELVAVNVVDWEFAEGRGVEAFLLLDTGWEVRFAHPLVTALSPGVRLNLWISPVHGLDEAIPVVCRLETPGTVMDSLPIPECPAPARR